jgi:hypothetical protein
MFEFGRELRRIFAPEAADEARPGLLELLDLALLRREAANAESVARRAPVSERSARHAEAALLHREIARRSGEAEALRRSASSAELAVKTAASGRAEIARARREQGLTALVGADLFGDAALMRTAREALTDSLARSQDPGSEPARAKAEAALAGLQSRRALAEGDFEAAMEAAGALDTAVAALDGLVKAGRACRTEAAAARCDRADLLLGFGARLREPRLLARAREDMAQLAARLDPAYEPLSWGRVQEVAGSVMVAEGEASGRAETILAGVRRLLDAAEASPEDHSPLDWARLQGALGAGLLALGEAAESEPSFAGAQAAFDRAVRIYDRHPALTARALAAGSRAVCLARRAERSGDLGALAEAEAAFKAELTEGPARLDPLAWAVTQTNLARIYEARDDVRGLDAERGAAVLALVEAREVFVERGLKRLAEAAEAALERLGGRISA